MVATEERNIRNELRMKLYTGRTRVVNGRGGAPIPESCADEEAGPDRDVAGILCHGIPLNAEPRS